MPEKSVDLLKASLIITRLVLSRPLLPGTAQGPDGSHAAMVAVVWGGIRCQCSPVSLCHPHTPRLLYSFEVVMKSSSEQRPA